MVFTLHRYIFRELIKVFILATVALTLILSLGSVLRPVQEHGVGPRQVIYFMGYSIPITLTFVLPMAALFAAALVYGRFSNDNELDACRASGLSMLTLVYPGLALAIIVAIANLILSFYVMPAFVHSAGKSLKADAQQIIFRNIKRRGYYESPDGNYRVYADHANQQNDTLSGVIITETKGAGIRKIITAENARVHFTPHDRFNRVQITAYNTYQMDAKDDGWFWAEWMALTTEFDSLMADNIKFKKIDEMKKIRLDPMRFYPIAKLAGQTYAQFTAELLAEDISIRTKGNLNNLYRLYSSEKIIEFTADQCNTGVEKQVELSGEVVVTEFDIASRQLLCTFRTTRALLHIEGNELAPTLTMELYNPTWQKPNGPEGLAHRFIIRGLVLPKTVTNKFKTEDVLKTISPAFTASALENEPSLRLTNLQKGLQKRIQKVFVKIKAEIHSRLVFGIGCIPVIMIGIGLGIIFKGGHLLTAFGASSIPAAVLIVCIMMGRNIAKNPGAQAGSGTVLMWVGLVVLSLLMVIIYRKLLRT